MQQGLFEDTPPERESVALERVLDAAYDRARAEDTQEAWNAFFGARGAYHAALRRQAGV